MTSDKTIKDTVQKQFPFGALHSITVNCSYHYITSVALNSEYILTHNTVSFLFFFFSRGLPQQFSFNNTGIQYKISWKNRTIQDTNFQNTVKS